MLASFLLFGISLLITGFSNKGLEPLEWLPIFSPKKTSCHGLNVCVSPKFICWSLNSHVMVTGGGTFEGIMRFRWGHSHHNGISVLIRRERDTRGPFPHLSQSCEDTAERKWGTRKRFSPGAELANSWILDLPISRTGGSKFPFFMPPSPWYFVLAAWMD